MHQLDIIVPARNEAESLPELLSRLHKSLTDSRITYRVIIVDDRSTDNTQNIVKGLASRYPVVLLSKKGQVGKASSIFQGAKYAKAEVLAMIDADLEYPPEALPQMYQKLVEGNHGVVVANRTNLHTNNLRRLGSRLNRFVFGRMLLGFNCDVQSGLKVFRREVISHLDPASVGAWAIDMPLLHTAIQLGYTLNTVKIQFTPRVKGDSKCRNEITRAVKQIIIGAVKTRFTPSKIYNLPSQNSKSPIGAGFATHSKRFVTHTQLTPDESAITTFHSSQKIFLLSLIALFFGGLFTFPLSTGIVITSILSTVYLIDMCFSGILVWRSMHHSPELSFSPERLASLSDDELPVYTLLCPLYKEARILPHFIKHISELNWPSSKLDCLLLLEEEDTETILAVKAMNLPGFVRMLIVPKSMPQTKPKACNYGLHHALGQYVVIYDAEDQPDRDQLKKAYLGFKSVPSSVVCLQAKLNYFNPNQNLLTRLFTAEYSLWFDVILPGYQSINTVIPLGGTSNHFKVSSLKQLNGWDAFNVTEDCDLGARLFKHGYKTALIDSTTYEEANSHLGNWLRQRSRWIKGYIQTWLVHNRKPLSFIKSHGWHAFFFQLVVGGKTAFTLINPFLWFATVSYFVLHALVGRTIEDLYPAAIFYMASFSAVFGNFLFIYYYMIALAKRGEWSLIKYVFLVPFYWVAVSIAAFKAGFQLIFKPHYWEKTRHGLHLPYISRLQNTKSFSWPKISISFPTLPQPKKLNWGGPVYQLVLVISLLCLQAILLARVSWSIFSSSLVMISTVVLYLVTTTYLPRLVKLIVHFAARPHLVSGSLLIFSSLVANVCNFIYNAYLGRTLTASEFGLVSLMSSFFYLTTIPTSALFRTATHRSAFLAGKFHTPARAFWSWLVQKNLKISLIFTVLWIISIPFLAQGFRSTNILAFVFFTPIWFVSFVGAVNAGYLNGSHRFSLLAGLTVLDSLVKVLLAILFVTQGLHAWVYAAVPISLLPTFFVGWVLANRLPAKPQPISGDLSHKFPTRFFATSVIVSLSTLAFLSFDVILAKTFLSPEAAGQYALLSLVGKMVYFIGTLFSQFIIPVVSHAEGKNQKTASYFNQLFAATLSVSLMGFVVVGIFGHITVPLLFGPQSVDIVSYLKWFTLSMAAFGAATAIVNYRHSQKHYVFPLVGFIFSLIHVTILLVSHASISDFVEAAVLVSLTYLLTVTFIHTFYGGLRTLTYNALDFFRLLAPSQIRPSTVDGALKILIFNWYDIRHKWAGGAESYIHEIASRWVAEGHSVTMFTGNDQTQKTSEVIDGVNVVRHGGQFTVALWAFLYYILKFRGQFDIVIDIPKGVPFFTPLYTGLPVVGLIHQVHQDMFRTELKFPARQIALFLETILMPLVYRRVPLVAVSPSTREAIAKIGLGKDGIDIVTPGVDITPTNSPKTLMPSVLYLGRLRPYKMVDVLISAINQLRTRVPNISLTIAGTGEDENRLKSLVKDLKLGDVIHFTGRVSDERRAGLFTESWIAVQPSMVEGWGITNIEANACKTPVIAAFSDGLKDSVVDGETGLLVAPGNPEALAEAIYRLIESPALLKRLSQNSVTWASKFNWDESSRQLLQIVKSHSTKARRFSFPFIPAWIQRRSA